MASEEAASSAVLSSEAATPCVGTPLRALRLHPLMHDLPIVSPALCRWLENPSPIKSAGSNASAADVANDFGEEDEGGKSFCWSIEQLAHLLPAEIDEEAAQYIDPEAHVASWTPRRRMLWQRRKRQVQAEIDKFFNPNNRIAPSPWINRSSRLPIVSATTATTNTATTSTTTLTAPTSNDARLYSATHAGHNNFQLHPSTNAPHHHDENPFDQGQGSSPHLFPPPPSVLLWSPLQPNIASPSCLRQPPTLEFDHLSLSDSMCAPYSPSSGDHTAKDALDCSTASSTSLCRRLFDHGLRDIVDSGVLPADEYGAGAAGGGGGGGEEASSAATIFDPTIAAPPMFPPSIAPTSSLFPPTLALNYRPAAVDEDDDSFTNNNLPTTALFTAKSAATTTAAPPPLYAPTFMSLPPPILSPIFAKTHTPRKPLNTLNGPGGDQYSSHLILDLDLSPIK